MAEDPIVYVFNFKDFKDVVMGALDKNGRSLRSLKKQAGIALSLLLACLLSVVVAYQLPKYSFLIFINFILFIGSLGYLLYVILRYYKFQKNLRIYEESFERIKYQKTIVTEDTITIETDLDTLTTKWQKVSDLVLEEGVITLKNGDDSYFFIERSMDADHVIKLKDIIAKKCNMQSAMSPNSP